MNKGCRRWRPVRGLDKSRVRACHLQEQLRRCCQNLQCVHGSTFALLSAQIIKLTFLQTFGGTNWGNLGYPGGYTSYDSASVIAEDRTVAREKFSEAKLQANFFRVSPAYLTSKPQTGHSRLYATNPNITVTRLGNPVNSTFTNFYIVRHSNYNSTDTTPYKLMVDTSIGEVVIPQLGSDLTLGRRDSKIHVTDYDVGGRTLIYSSGEIFTWTKSANFTVLILYGGEGEVLEFAFYKDVGAISIVEGSGVIAQVNGSASVVQWTVSRDRQIVHFGCGLEVHLLWRNAAYNYWTLHDGPYHQTAGDAFIIKAGYLMRNATLSRRSLYLTGDVNATTQVEVIASPQHYDCVYFNNRPVSGVFDKGRWVGTVEYLAPNITFHNFNIADWRFIDSLPEIQPSYDDSCWTNCSHSTSNNPRDLTTPTSLYAGDYGYHSGSLLYRGHFTANVTKSSFSLTTQGGYAFGHSVWLNDAFIGSWAGSPSNSSYQQTFTLPELFIGTNYVLTILIDHMGMEQNTFLGKDMMKAPRGILNYTLSGHGDASLEWKVTGNLGGEQYRDHARGPFNEGSMFAERQGFHLPDAPVQGWRRHSPLQGIPEAGVGFFYTSFDMSVPTDYDTPMTFVIGNTTVNDTPVSNFRLQLFVNGYQFGKYSMHSQKVPPKQRIRH